MHPCVLITAADARFFDLARELIQSVREKPEGQKVVLAFLDLGCTEEQRAWIYTQVDHLREVDWEFDFPAREQSPRYLRALHARPFLRQYFPGYETYVWIDADAWLQDWRTIELFVEGGEATARIGDCSRNRPG